MSGDFRPLLYYFARSNRLAKLSSFCKEQIDRRCVVHEYGEKGDENDEWWWWATVVNPRFRHNAMPGEET